MRRRREMPPGAGGSNGASEVIMPRGYWGEPTATIDWCEKNYEVRLNLIHSMIMQKKSQIRLG